MRKAILVPFILLSGCAGVTQSQCASDWYEQGHLEALFGNRPITEQHAKCTGFQEKDYLAGWSVGYSEWNQRVSGSRM